jgi:hypothetical protein
VSLGQDDVRLETSGEVTGPPDVGLSDEDRAEVERLASEIAELCGVRTGVVLAGIYRVVAEER